MGATFLTETFKVNGKDTTVGTALGRLKIALDILASAEHDPDHLMLNAIVLDEERARSLYEQFQSLSQVVDNLLQADYSVAGSLELKEDFNVFKIMAPYAMGVFDEVASAMSNDAEEQVLLQGEESQELEINRQMLFAMQVRLGNVKAYIDGIQAALTKHFPQKTSFGGRQ